MKEPIIVVFGGDKRQISLVRKMTDVLKKVRVFGIPRELLPPAAEYFDDWRVAVRDCAAVVLPLPTSQDGVRVNLPLGSEKKAPTLAELVDLMPQDAVLAGGKCGAELVKAAKEREIRLFDYFCSEELQQKNALPTAEGALEILMHETPRTIKGLPVGVTGYGRVARALVRVLLALGADVAVAARRQSDLENAAALGCRTVRLSEPFDLVRLSADRAAVVNTVPHWIFTEEVLCEMPRDTLILDLASAPGGVDPAAAAAQSVRVIWALSLPSKYAPESAGEIIAETLLSYFKEVGIC